MLASGYLPYDQAPIYTAESPVTVGVITMTNADSGTDSATFNLWYVPKIGNAILLTPFNLELLAGEPFELDDLLPMKAGDRLEAACSVGSYLHFSVRERT